MYKKILTLILCSTALLTTACSTNQNNTTLDFGEHKDTYQSLKVEQPLVVNKDNLGEKGTDTYKVNEDGSIKADLSFLENVTPEENKGKTEFELHTGSDMEPVTSDSEELYDKFSLLNNGITVPSVVTTISKISDHFGFDSVEIVTDEEEYKDEEYKLEYVVRFDIYDYYILTYYKNEGCTSFHDDTGTLFEAYGEIPEDYQELEWEDVE